MIGYRYIREAMNMVELVRVVAVLAVGFPAVVRAAAGLPTVVRAVAGLASVIQAMAAWPAMDRAMVGKVASWAVEAATYLLHS